MTAAPSWDCPICLRRVPAKVGECYCGYKHTRTPAPTVPARRTTRAVAIAFGLLVLGGALAWQGGWEPPVTAKAPAQASAPARSAVAREPLEAPPSTLSEAWKALAIEPTPVPETEAASPAAAEVPPTPAPQATPDDSIEAQRAIGVAEFQAALSALAAQADEFRQKRNRYHEQCTREDQQVTGCEAARGSLQDIARRIATDVETADETARRSWVEAGQRRGLRERNGLDDKAMRELVQSVSAAVRR